MKVCKEARMAITRERKLVGEAALGLYSRAVLAKKRRVIIVEICKWRKRGRRNVVISPKKANFHTNTSSKGKVLQQRAIRENYTAA